MLDTTVHPPAVRTLHLTFVGWLGSELIECFPVFAVTKGLAEQLSGAKLSGFELARIKVTLDEQFEVLYPDRRLPRFVWLKVVGAARRDDFGVDIDHTLVVSERALAVLQARMLVGCEVRPA